MADNNPWGNSDWSPAAQNDYLAKHGEARAQARARDAGTYYGGPPPAVLDRQRKNADAIRAVHGDPTIVPPIHGRSNWRLAEAAVVRRGAIAIYALDPPGPPLANKTDRANHG